MADNPPATPSPNPGPRPTLPGSTSTGRLPTTRLPVRTGSSGKIVVMLSSVAKPPPVVGTQSFPGVTPAAPSATPPPRPAQPPANPVRPPLPPKQVNVQPTPSRPQLSATTYVKLPPKTPAPSLVSFSSKPSAPPTPTVVPNSPPKVPELNKKPGAQLIPPIRLNEPEPEDAAVESIFLEKEKPAPASTPTVTAAVPAPAPIEAKAPVGEPVSLDLFEKSQPSTAKPAPVVTEAKERPAPLPPERLAAPSTGLRPVRPPPLPDTRTMPLGSAMPRPKPEKAPEPPAEKQLPPVAAPVEAAAPPSAPLHVAPPMVEKTPEPEPAAKLPPPLPATPPAKPVESSAPPTAPLHVAPPMLEREPEPPPAEKLPPPVMAKPVEPPASQPSAFHVAPRMLEQAPEPIAEKLAQPHLPLSEARPGETAPVLPEPPAMTRVPAMIKPDAPPAQSPGKPKRSITSWLKKKSQPIVVSSTAPKPAPIAEAKPALKPPVLPARSMLVPAPIVEEPKTPAVEAPKVVESKVPEKTTLPSTQAPAVVPAVVASALAGKKTDGAKVKAEAVKPPPSVPPEPKAKKAVVPLTRAERAKKRRLFATLFFWLLLFPATIFVLVWGSLRFGRDTRIEGQVIPPPGTVLSNEVWIVTDFRSLASGITEDLAAERTPILQDIQERQDHVQRAQADVASREERIRLIQQEISAAKADVEGVVKQARDATQQVWDVDGAQIDGEYKSRMDQLQQSIAARAKSLKLNYQPDPAFNSPEVWANAYRLALYQVPAGVDSVKEHAWLSDQMKQWRDYQKSMDDRTEALREKAAQIKLGPAPKIADLNSKMDGLNQRIDATEAEEVPLKGELAQAQADLATAQGADAGLDEKYYRQLYSLPGEAVLKRIPLNTNGRFTWVDDNVFVEGEKDHSYYIFARATRADGRQYWALGRISMAQNTLLPVLIEPPSFLSTKAILRPNLSPEEQGQ